MVIDEGTGAAGYMICGRLYNDTTIISGGSGTKNIHNLIAQLLHLTHIAKAAVPGLSALSVAFGIFYGALFMLDGLLPFYITLPFFFGFWLFGVIFICATYVLLVKLITEFMNIHAIIRRRKEYAYA